MPQPATPTTEGIDFDGLTGSPAADIVFAVLFGSQLRGDVDPSSDVDITLCVPEGIST